MDSANRPTVPSTAMPTVAPQTRRLDSILGKLDLIAIVAAFLGACLLGLMTVVTAAIEVFRLIPALWSNPVDRGIVIAFGVALLWVLLRGRKLCVT
jgi:hypothetical protein